MSRALEIVERMRRRYITLGVCSKDAKLGICGSFCAGVEGNKSAVTKDTTSERLLRQVITTSDIDLDEEVLDPSGADLSYLNHNKSVFLDHNYETEYSIGMIRWQKRMKGGDGIEASIAIDKGRRFADETWAIVQQRGGIGASIGFEATLVTAPDKKSDPKAWHKARCVVRKFKVIELSLTCLPCNVSCQTSAYKEDDTKQAEYLELLTKSVITPETAHAYGIGPKRSAVLRMWA